MGWFNHQLEIILPQQKSPLHFPPVSTRINHRSPFSFPLLAKARALQGLGRGGGFFERSVVEVDRTEVGDGVDGWLVGCRCGRTTPQRGFCNNRVCIPREPKTSFFGVITHILRA